MKLQVEDNFRDKKRFGKAEELTTGYNGTFRDVLCPKIEKTSKDG